MDFASQSGHARWLNPGDGENWGSDLLEFLLFHLKVMQRKAIALRAKVAAVRYFHLIHGKGDCTMYATRVKTLLKGIDKRAAPNAKWPFSLELSERMREDVETNKIGAAVDEKETIFVTALLGFLSLLRVSELAQVRRSDITIGETEMERRIILVIRRSKTDQSGQGVTRALLGPHTKLCPVAPVQSFLERCGIGADEPLFGESLRVRLEGGLKSAAIANGVHTDVMGAHSPRAGGATSLYIGGVSVVIIQRFGRWGSASFLRYLWYDSVALEPLSAVLATNSGMLNQLRMTRTNANNIPRRGKSYRSGGSDRSLPSPASPDMCADGWMADVEELMDSAERARGLNCRSPSHASVDLTLVSQEKTPRTSPEVSITRGMERK